MATAPTYGIMALQPPGRGCASIFDAGEVRDLVLLFSSLTFWRRMGTATAIRKVDNKSRSWRKSFLLGTMDGEDTCESATSTLTISGAPISSRTSNCKSRGKDQAVTDIR